MEYHVGEAVKIIDKAFEHVMQIAFVMSFVLILVLAVRFLVRKCPKSLSYGLWSVAGVGFLYAALPPLQLPLRKGMEGVGFAVQGGGFFSKLSGFSGGNAGLWSGNRGSAGAAAGDGSLHGNFDGAALSEMLKNISDNAKAIAAGSGDSAILSAGASAANKAASTAAISAGGSVPNGAGEIDALFSHGVSLWSILSVVWAIGVLLFFLYSIFAASRLQRRVRFAVKAADQSADFIGRGGHSGRSESFVPFSQNDWQDQAEKQRSSRVHKYRIYECAQIDSPFVAGIFRPKIYLPTGLTEYDRGLILAHEVCHIKRKDPLILLAAQILAVIFWFHPLFWAAYRMMRSDMEMSCDERAVKGLERTQVADYSAVLLSFSIKRSHPLAMTFGSGQSALKKRISNLLSEKRQSPLLSAAAAAVSLCGAAILITTGCAAVHSDVDFTEWFQPITLTSMEDSEAETMLKDMGTVIGQSQTVDGVTVTLDAAVRDEKNIILSFSVETEEELQIHGGMGESEESWMHGEWNLEEWKEQGGSDMTEEEFQQMYRSAEEDLKHLNKLQFLCAASENTGYRILLAGRIPSENTKLKVHLEDVNFSDVSLKGPFDFTFTAERRAQSTVYTGDIPMKTKSGEDYRVKKVSISPLLTGEIEIITDRDLSEDGSMEAPWNDEFVFDGIRIEGGLEFESVRTERTIDGANVTLSRDRSFSEKASVIRNDVILRRSADQVFIDPTKAEAVNIGGVWLDLDRMVMGDNGTAGSEKKSDRTANSSR